MRIRLAATAALALVLSGMGSAGTPAGGAATTVLARFLARQDTPLVGYRALRRLEARNDTFKAEASLDAWTELDGRSFRFDIVAETGSSSIRQRVLRAALEAERKAMAAGDVDATGFTPGNYHFLGAEISPEGLVRVPVKPRQKGRMFIDGAIFVTPDSADLVRIEGLLTKAPSFWTRRAEIVRRYARIGGVRVPVGLESIAQVLLAGRSTFSMTYEYVSVNGRPAGAWPLRASLLQQP